jgi:hypothetical protein
MIQPPSCFLSHRHTNPSSGSITGLTPFLDISGLFEIVAQTRQLPLQSSIEDNFGSPAYQVKALDYRRVNKLGMVSSQMALPMLGEKGA